MHVNNSCQLLGRFCEPVFLSVCSVEPVWVPGPARKSGPEVIPALVQPTPGCLLGGPSLFAQQNEERSGTIGPVVGQHARCQSSVAIDQRRRPAVINSPADLEGFAERSVHQTNFFFASSPKVWGDRLRVKLKLATGG